MSEDPEGPVGRPPEARRAARVRVLVVDDNADIAESLVMLLGLYGYEVSSVATGIAALDAIARTAPNVVLLDIGLPDIDGIEVARRLAGRPGRASVKVVAVSGYGERAIAAQAEAGLFDAHLLKPPAIDSLLRVLD